MQPHTCVSSSRPGQPKSDAASVQLPGNLTLRCKRAPPLLSLPHPLSVSSLVCWRRKRRGKGGGGGGRRRRSP
eukprot:9498372-Pyramimonas_sp.AAC.1